MRIVRSRTCGTSKDSHTRVMAARVVARRRYSESTHSRPRSESVVEVNRCLQEPLEVPTPMFLARGQPSRCCKYSHTHVPPFWPVAVRQPRILNPHHRPCWRGAHRRRAHPSGWLPTSPPVLAGSASTSSVSFRWVNKSCPSRNSSLRK